MKIVVSGGLGNQMFQYALYIALKDRGKDVCLDTSLYSHREMHNGYELERCFEIQEAKVKVTMWSILKLRLFSRLNIQSLIYKDKIYFNDSVFRINCEYLIGYWQSEKYFKLVEKKIREAFVFHHIDNENRRLADEIRSKISVAVHLRRGDYVDSLIHSDLCTEDYYLKAVEQVLVKISTVEEVMFYLFSDDKQFAKQLANKVSVPMKLVDINEGINSYKDLYLMSQCKHNIIANSSFSWWAAWLNENPKKIVIAPKRWFRQGQEEKYRDIVPESWLKL